MNNLLAMHLDDLTLMFFAGSGAHEAVEFFHGAAEQTGSESPLTILLRDHQFKGIHNLEEKRLRRSFDDFLEFCSLLEIACVVRYVPIPVPESLVTTVRPILQHRDVRYFSERFYPLPLVRQFTQRITDTHFRESLAGEPGDTFHPAFVDFLGLASRFRDDNDLQCLSYLIDYAPMQRANGLRFGLEEVAISLHDPVRVTESLTKPPGERDAFDSAIHGLSKFFNFSEELFNLLDDVAINTVVHDHFWAYFSYWYAILGLRTDDAFFRALKTLIASSNEEDAPYDAALREDRLAVLQRIQAMTKDAASRMPMSVPR